MSSNGELACTYALLILHEEGIPVTAEKIAKLLEVSKVSTESYWPTLFARLAEKRNIDGLILNVGSGRAAAPAAAPSGAVAAPAAAVDEKKEEPKDVLDDEEEEGLFSLFDD